LRALSPAWTSALLWVIWSLPPATSSPAALSPPTLN